MLNWWSRLIEAERPAAVTRSGGLLVAVGALNALQILVLLGALGGLAGDDSFVRAAVAMVPVQVIYGIVRIATGLAVLRGRHWAWPTGIGLAVLQMLGAVAYAATRWHATSEPIVGFEPVVERAVLLLIVGVVIAIDTTVIHGLVTHPRRAAGALPPPQSPPPREIDLVAPLPVEEVLQRLREGARQERPSQWFRITPFTNPLIVRIRGRNFRLRRHRNYGNAFGPLFYGTVEPQAGGTRLQGRFRMHPATTAFLVLWFGMLGLFAIVALLGEPTGDGDPIFGPMVAMGLVGAGIVAAGWLLSRNERRAIARYLDEVMNQPNANNAH